MNSRVFIFPWNKTDYKNLTTELQFSEPDEVRGIVHRYRINTPCAECYKNYHYRCMTFDHLDRGKKNFNVMAFVSKVNRPKNNLDKQYDKLRSLVAEIEMCEVVCMNCHAVRELVRDDEPASIAYTQRKLKDGMKLG